MSKKSAKKMPSAFTGERIAKRIAASGLCSRRQAEEWIGHARVTVNGQLITSPALNVTNDDRVEVDGKLLKNPNLEKPMVWKFHKPAGCLVTRTDPEGRPTIFDFLPAKIPPHIMPVGRLDFNSEGLLLLTNNGDLAHKLMHPSSEVYRVYRVRIKGALTTDEISKLRAGIKVEGIQYRPMKVEPEGTTASNVWVKLTLTEGKNREIRNIMDAIGHPVSRLVRLSYGPIQLGKMLKGECLALSTSQIERLTNLGKE